MYSWKGNLTEDDIVTTAGVTNAVALALSVITKVEILLRLKVRSILECYN